MRVNALKGLCRRHPPRRSDGQCMHQPTGIAGPSRQWSQLTDRAGVTMGKASRIPSGSRRPNALRICNSRATGTLVLDWNSITMKAYVGGPGRMSRDCSTNPDQLRSLGSALTRWADATPSDRSARREFATTDSMASAQMRRRTGSVLSAHPERERAGTRKELLADQISD